MTEELNSDDAARASAQRILVVDPASGWLDPMGAELAARYDLIVATDLAQAQAALRDAPDAIVYDAAIDGAVLRGMLGAADIPLIVIAPAPSEDAEDFIEPPVTAPALIGRLEIALRHRRLRREAAEREAGLRAEAEGILRRVNIVLTHLPFGVTMANPAGEILYGNPARDRLLKFEGYTSDSHLAERLPAFHPDGTPLLPDEYPIRRALKGELVTGLDIRYEYGGAQTRWIRAAGIPITDPEGNVQYAIGIASDITGEIEAQRQTARLTETLEERVRTEIEERLKAEDTIRQIAKLQAVAQLTGGVAHDFNNLLQVMLGNLEALERHLGGNAPLDRVRMHHQIGAALRGAERAAQLTRQLLAFARRQPLDPVSIDINRAVLGLTELLRRMLGERVEVATSVEPTLPRAFADPAELESSLLNLAVNARDAMPEGGRLTIETALRHFDPLFPGHEDELPVGDYVMVAVRDTGHGIPPDVLPHVLEPFFTTKGVGQGTGLGLSQVYGFAKQSGGHLEIESVVGAGTVVKLYLPVHHDTSEAPAPDAEATAHTPGSGDTILVVEDDPDVRAFSAEMLRELGYRTIEAADGASALRALEDNPSVRVVFADIGLPGGMSGRQLAEAAQARWPSLKILFTTGYASDTILRDGKLDPGIELIAKPFSMPVLAGKLRDLLA